MNPDWTKAVALFAGIAFFCVGIVLIYKSCELAARLTRMLRLCPAIDKGSAGLIVVFLGATIVISSLAFGTVDEQGQQKKISSFLWGITLFVISLGALVSTAAKII